MIAVVATALVGAGSIFVSKNIVQTLMKPSGVTEPFGEKILFPVIAEGCVPGDPKLVYDIKALSGQIKEKTAEVSRL